MILFFVAAIAIEHLFEVDGYKLQRRDRTESGGGIATYMGTDIPAKPEEGPYR